MPAHSTRVAITTRVPTQEKTVPGKEGRKLKRKNEPTFARVTRLHVIHVHAYIHAHGDPSLTHHTHATVRPGNAETGV
jgi:hypothetical protein